MQLRNLFLKDFRCFNQINLNFDSSLILIEGENGSGKTSILEALYYLGYLRSFKTHLSREMINFDSDNFFIKATLFNNQSSENIDLQAGFSKKKRLIKINQKSIQSYKELMDFYRVIPITEDDLFLIRGYPENRRFFIDQYIFLHEITFISILKKYKVILENRNKLINEKNPNYETYLIWTKQLWEQSNLIQKKRIENLQILQEELINLLKNYFNADFSLEFKYEAKRELSHSFELFIESNMMLLDEEKTCGRSLFGAHLDDFSIIYKEKKSRAFASRGQQKLLVLLIKIAQIRLLGAIDGQIPIFLLDDFLTDLDTKNIEIITSILFNLENQLIFTCPISDSPLKRILLDRKANVIKL